GQVLQIATGRCFGSAPVHESRGGNSLLQSWHEGSMLELSRLSPCRPTPVPTRRRATQGSGAQRPVPNDTVALILCHESLRLGEAIRGAVHPQRTNHAKEARRKR